MWNNLEVAHFWGILPSEFESASDVDKQHMTAYFQTKSEMRAVEDFELQKEIERLKKKGNKK